jgi:outer membrane protein assembly factor BamA
LFVVVVVASACAHRPPAPVTCGPGWSPLSGRHAPDGGAISLADPAAVIAAVRIAGPESGIDATLATTMRSVVETRPGQRVAEAPLAADLRRLWGLGVISDARVEVDGGEVAFIVTPRPTVGRVLVIARADPAAVRRFRLLAGAPFEPARITRIAAATELGYVRDGHLDAKVTVAHAPRGRAIDVCVAAAPGPRVTIDAVRFPGRTRIAEATLLAAIHGETAGVNHAGGIYDADALAADEPFLMAEYYERGMIHAKIGDPRAVRQGTRLTVELPIDEGEVFHLGSVAIPGVPAFRHDLAPGEVFARSRIIAVRDRLALLAGTDVLVVTTVIAPRRIGITYEIEWRWPWDALRSWSWPSH